ncbi:hypothetical protein D3C71_2148170 [compost metagenome]
MLIWREGGFLPWRDAGLELFAVNHIHIGDAVIHDVGKLRLVGCVENFIDIVPGEWVGVFRLLDCQTVE